MRKPDTHLKISSKTGLDTGLALTAVFDLNRDVAQDLPVAVASISIKDDARLVCEGRRVQRLVV